MKISLIGSLVLVFGIGSYAFGEKGITGKPDDKKFEELLVGKWKSDYKIGRVRMIAIGQYKKDKSYQVQGKLTVLSEIQAFNAEGTWRIKGGMVIMKVLKSSKPEMLPVGLVTKDKIIVLNNSFYTYKDNEGTQFTDKRMN